MLLLRCLEGALLLQLEGGCLAGPHASVSLLLLVLVCRLPARARVAPLAQPPAPAPLLLSPCPALTSRALTLPNQPVNTLPCPPPSPPQVLNIPTKITKGSVEITADVHLIKTGDKVRCWA